MKRSLVLLLLLTPAYAAAPANTSVTGLNLMNGGQAVSAPMQIVILMTVLTLLPAVLMCITPFLRITVVLHFLRQALGTQTAPSNQILMGLALMMTWFLMQPVLLQVDQRALTPYRNGTITGEA